MYAPLGSQKRQVSAERLLRTRSTFSKSVMVSVAVSLLGTTELVFIEPGVKINGAYYRDVLLGQHLLPAIRSVAGDIFTYNAPAHRAGDTVEFLSRNTPDFISSWPWPLPWPPNSPDLNPVDYEVWGILQQCIYHSRILDVDHLKQHLIEEWRCFDQNIIGRAVRLRVCVRGMIIKAAKRIFNSDKICRSFCVNNLSAESQFFYDYCCAVFACYFLYYVSLTKYYHEQAYYCKG